MATSNTPQIKPKVLLTYGRQQEPIRVPIYDLMVDATATFLTVDTALGVTSLTVKNISGFASNQVIIIGTTGNENCELIKTSTSLSPSGSTVTLASATKFAHSAGSPVTIINFDQIEYGYSESLGDSISTLTTLTITPDSIETKYNDTAFTTGFYYARFKNSINSTFSPYSDDVPVLGYGPLTARSLIDNALQSINKKTSDVLTDEFGFMQLNNCTTEVIRELKRWSFLQKFNYKAGTVHTATWRIELPGDCDDQNTNKSIYNIRIGTDQDLVWVDKEKWDEITEGVANTLLAADINVNDVSIFCVDSSNFDDGGTVYIGANNYSYTENDRSTGTLTLTVPSTTDNDAGEDVFFGGSLGMPQYWTTFGEDIYFYPIADSNHNNRSLFLDYYVSITQIYSDSDSIVFPDPTVAQYYLAWKFLVKQNNGIENEGSLAQKINFTTRLATMKNKETMNRTFQWKPLINRIDELNDDDGRQVRDGNFPNTGF